MKHYHIKNSMLDNFWNNQFILTSLPSSYLDSKFSRDLQYFVQYLKAFVVHHQYFVLPDVQTLRQLMNQKFLLYFRVMNIVLQSLPMQRWVDCLRQLNGLQYLISLLSLILHVNDMKWKERKVIKYEFFVFMEFYLLSHNQKAMWILGMNCMMIMFDFHINEMIRLSLQTSYILIYNHICYRTEMFSEMPERKSTALLHFTLFPFSIVTTQRIQFVEYCFVLFFITIFSHSTFSFLSQ